MHPKCLTGTCADIFQRVADTSLILIKLVPLFPSTFLTKQISRPLKYLVFLSSVCYCLEKLFYVSSSEAIWSLFQHFGRSLISSLGKLAGASCLQTTKRLTILEFWAITAECQLEGGLSSPAGNKTISVWCNITAQHNTRTFSWHGFSLLHFMLPRSLAGAFKVLNCWAFEDFIAARCGVSCKGCASWAQRGGKNCLQKSRQQLLVVSALLPRQTGRLQRRPGASARVIPKI